MFLTLLHVCDPTGPTTAAGAGTSFFGGGGQEASSRPLQAGHRSVVCRQLLCGPEGATREVFDRCVTVSLLTRFELGTGISMKHHNTQKELHPKV